MKTVAEQSLDVVRKVCEKFSREYKDRLPWAGYIVGVATTPSCVVELLRHGLPISHENIDRAESEMRLQGKDPHAPCILVLVLVPDLPFPQMYDGWPVVVRVVDPPEFRYS
ncbi:MAG: hypothetical protein A3I44_05820 [Candidatus Sungbacteria bacterium RIFCSPLOWO2_02_FULL_51_17]|nr:MAG: hypothetical protein A2676_04980 [Candidatus Sungbacteria bacterium RIFCSPHIGHO2_01_FULL_51_22]OHA04778.1 MAG: hypothetical protein A3B29_02030 [Candidatus Sungbacteria bacterium RIFCSPLOWO2_01_FULL_51_34]OHA12068.1 MAG: hypothetical protein A3I44_05820 [Candidatus Sungbacteria bacterium RIFCSPLOWO2_02_FULL_51_17]